MEVSYIDQGSQTVEEYCLDAGSETVKESCAERLASGCILFFNIGF